MLSDFLKDYLPSARMSFYFMIAYVIVLIIVTSVWASAVFMEVTRKRASKLSVKYGGAEDKSKNATKLVVAGIIIAIAWIIFIIVL